MRVSKASWAVAILTLAALYGCGRSEAPPAKHVVLVTIDTLRADRLGVYGSEDVETPNLDAIADAGAIASTAVVHTPLTRPSHTSLFTGRLPPEHGIRDNISPTLSAELPVLAEMLRDVGFRTAAFVSSVVLSSQSGLDRGFDLYSDDFEGGDDDARFLNTVQKSGDKTLEEASAWLSDQRASGRLFSWIHLYDPHDPYEPPEPYRSRYADRLYDGEVAWTDELIGRLDDTLRELELSEDTLLVITSDHGESLGEHGEPGHGFFIYDATLKVPLIFRGPGVEPGTRLLHTVRSVDLPRTILELVGVQPDDGLAASGRSVAAALGGEVEPAEAPTYAESLVPLIHFGWSDLRSVREGGWKYIEAPSPELYNIDDDPDEQENLVSTRAATAARMRDQLAAFLEDERDSTEASGEAVPAELLEQLGALGYLGPGATGSEPTGEDPKDKVSEFRTANALMRQGLVDFHDEDLDASIASFEELLSLEIESFEIHYYLARALLAKDRNEASVPHFEAAVARHPSYAAAYEGLAQARLSTGATTGALQALAAGREAAPDDGGLALRHARLLRQLGRNEASQAAFEAALPLVPEDALARVQLGELLRDMGQAEPAITRMREAVALEPETASYWNSLGMVLGGQESWDEARHAFETAIELDGDRAMYTYNLGLVLLRSENPQDARQWFEITLDLNPEFEAARAQLDRLSR